MVQDQVPPPLVDLSASVEAMMAQALDKAMTRVTSQLDDCLENMLEPKVTAVLQKIASNSSPAASHNVPAATERETGGHPPHNVSLT